MDDKWSDRLVRNKLSDFLLEDVAKEASKPIPDDILNSLRREVCTKEDLKALKSSISELKKHVAEDIIDLIHEEYEEIKEDLDWAASKKGKTTLTINDWAQTFYGEFRSNNKFSDVYIGGHNSKNVVFVAGQVSSQEILKELEAYVASKQPPFKVLYEVKIKT